MFENITTVLLQTFLQQNLTAEPFNSLQSYTYNSDGTYSYTPTQSTTIETTSGGSNVLGGFISLGLGAVYCFLGARFLPIAVAV